MITSPLEQFNILSVYDFSLANISSFETIYADTMVRIWHIVHNIPRVICSDSFFQGNFFSVPFHTTLMALFWLYNTATEYFWPIFFFDPILDGIWHIIFRLCDIGHFIYLFLTAPFSTLLSFVWYTFYANLNLLYSADHLFLMKSLDFFAANENGTLLVDPISSTNAQASPWTERCPREFNLSLLYGTSGPFLANAHSLLEEVSLLVFLFFYQNTIQLLFGLGTKDLSYLILSLNTSTIWLLLGFGFITFLLTSTLAQVTLLPKNNWQTLLEAIYGVILDVVNENAGPKGLKHFPLIFTTFMLILVCNFLGMIPYSFTVTSHLIVTFSMALAIFIGINILGILKNGRHFLSLFFPPGAPLALAPLLVFIELISYVFRVLSLSIRLFANLMSGHTLLKILSSFSWAAVSFWGIFLVPIVIIFLITGLELAIAALQAYIFSVLLCIYINDAFNLH